MTGLMLLNGAFHSPLLVEGFQALLAKRRPLFLHYKMGYWACLTEVDLNGVRFNIVPFLLFFVIFDVYCVCNANMVPEMRQSGINFRILTF